MSKTPRMDLMRTKNECRMMGITLEEELAKAHDQLAQAIRERDCAKTRANISQQDYELADRSFRNCQRELAQAIRERESLAKGILALERLIAEVRTAHAITIRERDESRRWHKIETDRADELQEAVTNLRDERDEAREHADQQTLEVDRLQKERDAIAQAWGSDKRKLAEARALLLEAGQVLRMLEYNSDGVPESFPGKELRDRIEAKLEAQS